MGVRVFWTGVKNVAMLVEHLTLGCTTFSVSYFSRPGSN